jgi:hypothetical protein
MKSRAAGHRSHRKDLKLDPFAVEIGIVFLPVDLRFDAPAVALWNERLVFGSNLSGKHNQLLTGTN